MNFETNETVAFGALATPSRVCELSDDISDFTIAFQDLASGTF
jgi:hypothetical protein